MPGSGPGMTPPFGLASALFSDSIVKQPAHSRPKDGVASLAYARKISKQQTDVIHRPHYLFGVGTAVISLPSPT